MEQRQAALQHRRRVFDQAAGQVEAEVPQIAFAEGDARFPRRWRPGFEIDGGDELVRMRSGLVIDGAVFFPGARGEAFGSGAEAEGGGRAWAQAGSDPRG